MFYHSLPKDVVTRKIKRFRNVWLHDVLHWLCVRQQTHFKLCYVVRNCVVSTAPAYLQELCLPAREVVQHQRLPSATYGDLYVPRVATDRFGWQAFSVTGPQLWNHLPVTTRATSTNTSDCFKRVLKTFLFQWVGVLLQLTAPLRNGSGGGLQQISQR